MHGEQTCCTIRLESERKRPGPFSLLGAMPQLLERPEFAAPLMCSEVDMESFMMIRIRHCDKNIASTQQPGISGLRPKPILHLQASYTAIATVFGVLYGSI